MAQPASRVILSVVPFSGFYAESARDWFHDPLAVTVRTTAGMHVVRLTILFRFATVYPSGEARM